jgi:hypothetical protein
MSVYTNPAHSSPEQTAAYVRALLELLGDARPLAVLRDTPAALRQALAGLTDTQLSRPEAAGKWSVRQVLRHLADSEIVWAYRLRMILAHDRPPLTGYDQDAWAERLHYETADVTQSLELFAVVRGANLRLLARASAEDLQRVGVHAERGAESIEHLLRLYAGHDLLHLRQLARVRAAVTPEP